MRLAAYRQSKCRLGTTRRIAIGSLALTVLNGFEAWSLWLGERRLAWRPIDYGRYE